MPHALMLYPKLPEPDGYLERLVGDGTLRAAAHLPFGPYEAMAMAYSESTDQLVSTTSKVCADGLVDCLDGLLAPLYAVPNVHIPGEVNLYAFVELAAGGRRPWTDLLQESVEREDDTRASAAHVFGIRGVDALVSVVADSSRRAADRLFELVDRPEVTSVHTAFVNPRNAFGWGSELARLE